MAEHARISAEDAEEYTQALGQVLGGGWRLIWWAHRNGIPASQGLSTEEWVRQRLGGYVHLAVSDRRQAVAELDAEGLSNVAIGAILGADERTVRRDKSANADPEPGQSEDPQVRATSEPGDSANAERRPDEKAEAESVYPRDSLSVEDKAKLDVIFSGIVEDEETEAELAEPGPTRAREHVEHNSGDHEWFTPPDIIEAARSVLGEIDLDPATTPEANAVIRAADHYTAEDDGLTQSWKGRVWLNPPYASRLVGAFTAKLIEHYAAGDVPVACLLVNNATETTWFQAAAAHASAICFPRGRLTFWYPGKRTVTPLQGQAILYLGSDPETFAFNFAQFGTIVARLS